MNKLVVGGLVIGGLCLMAQADSVWYAKPDGGDDSDCQTWETAGTISNAVARMKKSGAGTSENRKWVMLKSGTVENPTVYDLSGVAGGALVSYITLDSDYLGIRSEDEENDPRKIVVKGGGFGAKMRFAETLKRNDIYGLTLTNFCANGQGGAILMSGGTLVISNCNFFANMSVGSNGGGAVASASRIAGCDFVGNVSTNAVWGGGATYNVGYITNCNYIANCNYGTSHHKGGADCVSTKLEGCYFEGNRSFRAGTSGQNWGHTCYGESFYNCMFTNSPGCNATFYRCTFDTCGDVSGGGEKQRIFHDCVIRGCSTMNITTAYNCLIVGNDAESGVLVQAGTFYNCTIADNKTTGTGNNWNQRAIVVAGVKLYNCFLYNPSAFRECSGSGSTVGAYNCLLTRFAAVTPDNCISMEARGWGRKDLRLDEEGAEPYLQLLNSPLVDNGATFSIHSTECTNDIRGLSRQSGAAIDIGCYERQVVPVEFDIANIEIQRFDGTHPCCPHPVITRKADGAVLVEGRDYELVWSDNAALGTGFVMVNGLGVYVGQVATKTYTIKSSFGEDYVFFAKPDGADDSDCLTWATAGTISNAVNRMLKMSGGGTEETRRWVVLRAGSIEEPAIYDLSTVHIPNTSYITISKAYSGIRSEADDSDPRRIWVKGGGAGSPKRFLTVTAKSTRVKGLTIANFVWTNDADGYAAGIYGNSSAVIECCDFDGNQAAYCGAVYGPQTAVTGCTFRCNRATKYEFAAAAWQCNAVDCTFTSNANFAVREGIISNSLFVANLGGIGRSATLCGCEIVSNRFVDTVNAGVQVPVYGGTMRDCLFYGNAAPEKTGSQWTADIIAQAVVENCTFVTNEVNVGLGGLFQCSRISNCTFLSNYGGKSLCTDCRVSSCLFSSNSCSKVISGGTIDRCRILWNKGIAYSIYATSASTMSDCLIAHNTGDYAISGNNKGVRIRGCTIVSNNSFIAGISSGFATAYPVSEISNSIIIGNGSLDFQEIRADANYNCFTNVIYGVRANGTGTWFGCTPLTVAQVKFAEPDELHPYGYGLKKRSPAVNHGFDLGYAPDALDLAGTNRVLGAAVDIGCYEYAPHPVGFMIFVR